MSSAPSKPELVLSYSDLTFSGQKTRGLLVSNLSKDGFICVGHFASKKENCGKRYEFTVFEIGLDMEVKRKIVLAQDRNVEFLDRFIYLEDGLAAMPFIESDYRSTEVHYTLLDLKEEKMLPMFSVSSDEHLSEIVAGDQKSGYSFAFSKKHNKGIWIMLKGEK